jgi:hypothetical protein
MAGKRKYRRKKQPQAWNVPVAGNQIRVKPYRSTGALREGKAAPRPLATVQAKKMIRVFIMRFAIPFV